MSYVDTSVLAAYYCPEALSSLAQKEISMGGKPSISQLTEVEMASVLALKIRIGEMPAANARRVLACFKSHCADGEYVIFSVSGRDYALASEWLALFESPLKTLDSLHLAVAFNNGLDILTADHILAKAAKHFGVKYKLIS